MKREITIILAFIALILATGGAFPASGEPINAPVALLTRLKETEKKYSIEVRTGNFATSSFFRSIAKWETTGKEDKKMVEALLGVFVDEWNKYPTEYVRFSQVKTVALAKKLIYAGAEVGGLADVLGNTLVLNVDFAKYEEVESYIIHHEFFHYVDVIKMGDTAKFYNDPVWKKLNPASFTYAGKGVDMLKGDADITSLHPRQGFITLYATSAVEEDKAEVFAYLFTEGLYQKGKKYIEDDAVLKNKFAYMKTVYLRGISADFTDEFFNKLHNPVK